MPRLEAPPAPASREVMAPPLPPRSVSVAMGEDLLDLTSSSPSSWDPAHSSRSNVPPLAEILSTWGGDVFNTAPAAVGRLGPSSGGGGRLCKEEEEEGAADGTGGIPEAPPTRRSMERRSVDRSIESSSEQVVENGPGLLATAADHGPPRAAEASASDEEEAVAEAAADAAAARVAALDRLSFAEERPTTEPEEAYGLAPLLILSRRDAATTSSEPQVSEQVALEDLDFSNLSDGDDEDLAVASKMSQEAGTPAPEEAKAEEEMQPEKLWEFPLRPPPGRGGMSYSAEEEVVTEEEEDED